MEAIHSGINSEALVNGLKNVGTKDWWKSPTNIAWCDGTFNTVWGCSKISEGCRNCYADEFSKKLGFGSTRPNLWGEAKSTKAGKGYNVEMGRRVFGADYWNKLLKWNQMARDKNSIVMVFTSSMADNFEKHPTTARELEKLWSYIRKTPNIHYQILPKRAERIRECLPEDWYDYRNGYPNVWLGVSVESNEVAYRFNDYLADIPAAVRFMSYEPAIGPLTDIRWEQLDWLIAGGESGSQRRPFEHDWARYVHQQWKAHGVAFFYKQDTAFRSSSNPYLDGKKYYEYPSPRA